MADIVTHARRYTKAMHGEIGRFERILHEKPDILSDDDFVRVTETILLTRTILANTDAEPEILREVNRLLHDKLAVLKREIFRREEALTLNAEVSAEGQDGERIYGKTRGNVEEVGFANDEIEPSDSVSQVR